MNASNSTFRPRCPTCQMLVETDNAPKFLPFCSDRCRLIDLGRWLNEEHAVTCDENDESEAEVEPTRTPKLPPGWHDA
ncbi:DNA gyrase inhibitor YacG [Aureliella helgolandensis]|uniref:DNA gyrase inhibitor YacG n=1 Tax=Aureliella helgolandensis TaxID=2527968 RepID=A0A518G296_9BACT|nr:DNA gyrase inhibitor YacG [Aureliella helgolandensis]QDV22721.1 DNA gyrase inhibitor YacG [Aureliella helgolandensis]